MRVCAWGEEWREHVPECGPGPDPVEYWGGRRDGYADLNSAMAEKALKHCAHLMAEYDEAEFLAEWVKLDGGAKRLGVLLSDEHRVALAAKARELHRAAIPDGQQLTLFL